MSSSGFPLAPGAVIGILGGGQLGRMLALAAARLGFDVVILTPETDSPAGRVAARTIVAPYDDPAALAELAKTADVVTYEFENVPAAAVARLEALGVSVAPGPDALAVAQDRVKEKTFFELNGIPTVAFAEICGAADIAPALERLGAPALLKTRREGYDGKGQAWVRTAGEAEAAFEAIGRAPAVLEAKAAFVREVSVIAARGRDGSIAAYPLTENQHEDGILRRSIAPAQASPQTKGQALSIVTTLLDRLDYVGVIGVEMFELADGKLLVNEFAPRVHNSGHWTLDACQVDQFEQQIRAVAGWPLGPTEPLCAVEMLNLLGAEAEDWAALAADPTARVWLYGKRGSRAFAARRKVGHVNRLKPLK
jgi:5-(carboxyamino)imidazole ribonucleotide synthase